MSPRTARQFEEIREEKRNLIMDVALEHFGNAGYHATTINHIAKHAGISKGLMYNYFESKEFLLAGIISRSIAEIYAYFDIDRDGILTEDEFDYFIRRMAQTLKEKRSFWRLFFQLLMQNEVREQFLISFLKTGSLFQSESKVTEGLFLTDIMKMMTDYFIRKKERMTKDYDPYFDLNMFIITLKGYAITYIYVEKEDEIKCEKIIEKIIELYK